MDVTNAVATYLSASRNTVSFSYDHIGEDDIRLLTINAHDGRTALLELHTYSRVSAPDYDAVSYAWGNDTSTTSVICNGFPLEIKTNLFKALLFIHSFRPEPARPLWIDAISLNQDDHSEKALHVPLMGEVYENATRTIIWLGESAADSDLAMDSIHSLTQAMLAVENPYSLTLYKIIAKYGLPTVHDQRWKALKSLQLRPWFFRLWTLQEIVLSKEPVMLCGRKSVPWHALVALHGAAMQAGLLTMVRASEEPETPFRNSHIFINHVDFLRKQRENGTATNLPVLLMLSIDRGYSTPVDRIWALLGLLNKSYRQQLQRTHVVNYSDTAKLNYHETFFNIAKLHVKYDTSLAMQLIEGNLRSARNPLLPSWCPDWHTDNGAIPLSFWPEACSGIPGGRFRCIEPFMQVNEDSSLYLCGLFVDSIERVTVNAGKPLLDLKSYSWVTECLEIVKSIKNDTQDVYDTNGAVRTEPTTYTDGTPIHELRQRYNSAEEALKDVLYPAGIFLDSSSRTLLRCNGRKFFGTKAGRFGLGPSNLEKDDLLCAMYGARALFALRPRRPIDGAPPAQISEFSRQVTEGEEFELLGSAYTPGLLKGEAFVGISCESMRRFRLR